MFELINDICKDHGGHTTDDSGTWMVQFPSQKDADDVVKFVNAWGPRENWYAYHHCTIAGLIVIKCEI